MQCGQPGTGLGHLTGTRGFSTSLAHRVGWPKTGSPTKGKGDPLCPPFPWDDQETTIGGTESGELASQRPRGDSWSLWRGLWESFGTTGPDSL